MNIQVLILLALALAATFFVLVVSVGLVLHKAISVRRTRARQNLYKQYAAEFAELLLRPLPPLPPGSKTSAIFEQYESLVQPIKQRINALTKSELNKHRTAIRLVLVDFAQDLRGDATDRLVYFFYSFDFVGDYLRLLQHRHWWIRAQAARDMGLVKARKSITALTAALEDPHPDVRNQAMRSLVAIVGVEALRTIFRISRQMTRWSQIELSLLIVQFGKEAVPALLEGLDSSDATVVSFCVEMLGEIGFVSAVEPLVRLARTTFDVELRAQIAKSLGRLGDQRAEPLLKEFARNPSRPLRHLAIESLGRLGSPRNVPFLMEQLRGDDIDELLVIGRALMKCGADGREALESLRAVQNEPLQLVLRQLFEESAIDR
jgi:HEAT repeat protein